MTKNILNWELYYVQPAEVGFWKIQFPILSRLKQIPATIKKSCQCYQGYLTPWCKHQQRLLITRVGNFEIGNSTDQLCWRGATNNVRFWLGKTAAPVHLCQRNCQITEAGVDYLHSLFDQQKLALHRAELYS